MKKSISFLSIFVFLSVIILGVTASPAQGQSSDGALEILEADEEHLLLELTLPSFDLQTITHDGVSYQRLQVPGWGSWGQPGYPQLPSYSVPLGLPWPGEAEISVVEADSQVMAVGLIYPAPALTRGGTDEAPEVVETFAFDADVYRADTLYPGPLTAATDHGFLRDQPLFQLRLYPFQYNPVRQELRVYHRLKVLVTFPPGLAPASRAQDSPVFERILERTLLNYDLLPRPTSDLGAADTGATYVIITHPDFYDAVQGLKTYRQSQGESVAVVTTQEIYDDFNGGVKSPQSIRSFLQSAYAAWSPKPVYVLLVGDASRDPTSLPDLLPAYYVATLPFGQAPNDAWYAKVHGSDNYPDLIVGRIPARSPGDVAAVVNKVQVYEGSPPPGDWLQRALLVADDDDPVFRGDMDIVADLLPADITPTKMYAYNPNTNVQDEIGVGALLVAYSGHGNKTIWGSWSGGGRIYQQSQVADLENGDKLPFITVANCLNGEFSDSSQARVLAEEFLLVDNKGGVAAWAPSSFAFTTIDTLMYEALYETLFVDGDLTLGSAVTAARIKVHLDDPDLPLAHIETFTYFGDPAVDLNVADAPIEGLSAGNDSPTDLGEATILSASISSGTHVVYTWDFGDGSPSQSGLLVQHTYPAAGAYVAQVTATNNVSTQSATTTVVINDAPPGASPIYLPMALKNNPF
jgi:hypothetical protein